jgi:hypothetical protein
MATTEEIKTIDQEIKSLDEEIPTTTTSVKICRWRTDFRLICSDQDVWVNKYILIECSKRFEDLFSTDSRTSDGNQIVWYDKDYYDLSSYHSKIVIPVMKAVHVPDEIDYRSIDFLELDFKARESMLIFCNQFMIIKILENLEHILMTAICESYIKFEEIKPYINIIRTYFSKNALKRFWELCAKDNRYLEVWMESSDFTDRPSNIVLKELREITIKLVRNNSKTISNRNMNNNPFNNISSNISNSSRNMNNNPFDSVSSKSNFLAYEL